MIAALEIEQLDYSYKSNWLGRGFTALKSLNLSIAKGEAFAFLGHNGAGKTTTIKCALGLIRPTRGTVRLFGRDSRLATARRAVGYLPEQPYFYDHLKVTEILDMYGCLAGLAAKDRKGAIEKALELVKLSPKKGAYLRELSKGLTQRVAMAQALLASPELLILDEPFSGLDPIGRKEFRDLLAKLKQTGVTIFISSHILGDIEDLCDRAAILAKGELKGVFSLKQLDQVTPSSYQVILEKNEQLAHLVQHKAESVAFEDDFIKYTFPDRSAAEELLKDALNRGFSIRSFQEIGATLEDLFVKLVSFDEAKGV